MSRPLRVVVANASLNLGGAERVLAQLASGLRAAGLDVHVCCLYEAGPVGEALRRGGVPLADGFLRNKADVIGFVRLARWLRRTRPDVFYFNNQPLTQLWGSLASRAARVPVEATAFHFTVRDPKKARRGRLANRILGGRTDLCIALFEGQKEGLVRDASMPRGRIVVIPNGVDADRFDVSFEQAAATRAELGVPESAFVVGMVAQLRPEKNHEMLLRVAARVGAARDDAVFLVAGGGEAQRRLDGIARRLGVERHVRLLGVRPDVPEIMAACDAGVLCSLHETFPLAVLELMAAGRPVVSTDVGAVSEVVTEETGFVVPVDDDRAMADRLLQLAGDAALRKSMGEAGRRRARESFTVSAMVHRTKAALEDAVARKRGGPASQDDVVVIVGPRLSSRGGVSTHLATHLEGGLREWFDLVPVEVGLWDAPASRLDRALDALRKGRELRRHLRTHPGAIVHLNPSMDTKSLVRDMPFLWIAARRRAPIVVQFHGQLMHRYRAARNPVFRRLMLASLRRAALVVVLSSAQARSLEQVFGGSAALRVREMPALFLDLRPYEGCRRERTAAEGIRRFLFLGRVAKEKGLGDLFEAVAALEGDAILDVVGSGPDEEVFHRRAAELGIDGKVTWHGYTAGDAKLDLLAAADAFVLPSWGEGLPNALVEAMAMGLPVVVTETGAMPQVVEDGVNGFVVPVGDARALAQKITYLMENPEEALEMGKRNRALARERFGLDRQVEEWRAIYEGVRRHA